MIVYRRRHFVIEIIIEKKSRKKMAMSSSHRKRVRYTFDIQFTSQEEKETFQRRLKSIRERLTPTGSPSLIDNHSLMTSCLDAIDRETTVSATVDESTPVTKSLMRNSG